MSRVLRSLALVLIPSLLVTGTLIGQTALNVVGATTGYRITGFDQGSLEKALSTYPSGGTWLWQLPLSSTPVAIQFGQSLQYVAGGGTSAAEVTLEGDAAKLKTEGFLAPGNSPMDVGLNTVRADKGRYLMVFGAPAPGNKTISVLEIEDSGGKPVVKTYGIVKDAVIDQTPTLGLIGLGYQPNGGLVVTGDAANTYLFDYTVGTGQRISNPSGRKAGNQPANFVFLSAGPGPEPGSFFVAGINNAGGRKVEVRYLKDGSYQGGVVLDFTAGPGDYVVPGWDPYSPGNVTFAVYQAGGTRVLVYRGLTGSTTGAVAFKDTPNSGIDLRGGKAPPLALVPYGSSGEITGFIAGLKQGESVAKLWRVNLSTGVIEASGIEFAAQRPPTMVVEIPVVSVGIEALDSTALPAGQNARFDVFREGATAGDLEVSYQTGSDDQSATAGVDYDPGTGKVTIPSGSSKATLSIPVKPYDGCKNERSFYVSLTGLPIAGGKGKASARIALTSNCEVTIRPESVTINPGERARYTVERKGNVSGPYDVGFDVAPGVGTPANYYSLVETERPLKFGKNESTKTVTVEAATTTDECRTAGSFTVTVTASSSNSSGKTAMGNIAAVTAKCQVSITGPSAVVPADQEAVFVIRREGTSVNVDQTVDYSVAAAAGDGRWQKDLDYQDPGNGKVSFRVGDQQKEVRIKVLKPPVCRNGRAFSVTLTGFGTSASASVEALAACKVGILPSTASMDPGGNAVFAVSRDGDLTGPFDAAFTVNPGTGTGLGDFTAPASPLRFLAGESSKQLRVDAASTTDECRSARSFEVTVPGGAKATGTINARTNCPFTVAGPPQAVSPNQEAVFGIERTGSAVQQAQTYTYVIEASLADGRWQKGLDYNDAGNGSVSFAAGDTRREVRITILNPAACRNQRSFSLKVTSPSVVQAPGTVLALTNCSVQITPGTLAVNPGQTATFVVSRDGDLSGPYKVEFVTDPPSSSDFTAPSSPLNFGEGEGSKPLAVPTAATTALCRTGRSFKITLAGGSTATGTINAVAAGCQVVLTMTPEAFPEPLLPGDDLVFAVSGNSTAFNLAETTWQLEGEGKNSFELDKPKGQQVTVRALSTGVGTRIRYSVLNSITGTEDIGWKDIPAVANYFDLLRLDGPSQVLKGSRRQYGLIWQGTGSRASNWLTGRQVEFKVGETACTSTVPGKASCVVAGDVAVTARVLVNRLTPGGNQVPSPPLSIDVKGVDDPGIPSSAPVFERYVPVAFEADGLNSASFETEITLVNTGGTDVEAELDLGGWQVTEFVKTKTVQVINGIVERFREETGTGGDSDLRGKLYPLTVRFRGAASDLDVEVLARVSTPSLKMFDPTKAIGRAGLAYKGLRAPELFSGARKEAWLVGLRGKGNDDTVDRTNVAMVNPVRGTSVRVKWELYSDAGDMKQSAERDLEGGDVIFAINRVGQAIDAKISYAKVTWVSGGAFYAYATPNNNVSNDGSWVFPASPRDADGASTLLVPVVQRFVSPSNDATWRSYVSDLAVNARKGLGLKYDFYPSVLGGVPRSKARPNEAQQDVIGSVEEKNQPQTGVLKDLFDISESRLGILLLTRSDGQPFRSEDPVLAGSRTDILAINDREEKNGRFGVYLPAEPLKSLENLAEISVLGLQRTGISTGSATSSGVRSNLALMNPGDKPMRLRVRITNGDNSEEVPLPEGKCKADGNGILRLEAREFCQVNDVLNLGNGAFERGYAKIEKLPVLEGANPADPQPPQPFFAYGVVNDNQTNDGAYLLAYVKSCDGLVSITEPAALPNAEVGRLYGPVMFRATPAGRGYKWAASNLPSGLSLVTNDATGDAELSGTANTERQAQEVVVTVTDRAGCQEKRIYSLAVQQVTFTLTVAKSGQGTVRSSPPGIDCGFICSSAFVQNQSVTLTAVPEPGWNFQGWNGAGCSGTGTCQVTMDGNKNVTATFVEGITQYTLTVTKDPSGTGTGNVTSDPAGIDCGSTCSASFDINTSITLTATASSGSTFAGWSGACSGTGTCQVTMNQARSATAKFNLAASACPTPVITVQPQSQTISSGATATLSVDVAPPASGTLSYQWYEGMAPGGSPISGATNSSYTTPALTQATSYWVKVTNTCTGPQTAVTNSSTATIAIQAPPCPTPVITVQPQSQTISSGATATLSVDVAPPASGTLSYQWYQGMAPGGSPISGATNSSYTTPALTQATSYWVKVTNTCTGPQTAVTNSSTATISIQALPCPTPVITVQPQSQTISSGATATLSVDVAPPASGTLSYQWYEGMAPGGSPISGATNSSYTTPALTQATSYWVKVTNTCTGPQTAVTNSSTATISIQAPPCPTPVITVQPQSQTISGGATATLSVDVAPPASGALSYQWYEGMAPGGSPISGATNSSYTTPALTQATSYWVKVTNTCAGPQTAVTNSSTATISIQAPPCPTPVITVQPQSQTISSGATATLSVDVAPPASGALSYQWYEGTAPDGTPISGATSKSYKTPILTTTTSYWVKVTNTCGPGRTASVDSGTAVITVQ